MALTHYSVDMKDLSIPERDSLLASIDQLAFMTIPDLTNPGCFEVFWDNPIDICEAIHFPPSCTISLL